MSIIQTIRDKGARISVMLIALALIGFILTDYFSSRNRSMFRGSSDVIGKVNGRRISFEDFNRKKDINEENMRKQGYPSGGQTSQMALDNTWEQEVTRIVMDQEFDELGITVSSKELGDILYGPNAPADLKQQFTDPKTGQYNAVQAKQQIDQILKKGTPEQKASFNEYINALIQQRKQEKYLAMATNSANVPKWFVQKQQADNSQMASISFVKEIYSAISDSAVKVDDKEIEDYVNKHKDNFKQAESRSFNYVVFSAAPSSADTLDAYNKLLAMKAEFDTTKSVEQMLLTQGIDASFNYDGYKTAGSIQSSMKDSIIRTPVGLVYGPYLEGNSLMLARVEGVHAMPDTVKVRHILIATTERDQQSGQMYEKRDSASAYKLADSIRNEIAKGANFDTLCAKFSDDGGSKDKGGVYENVPSGQMVGPFNDFIFLNPVGYKGIVKTQFGYHYVEILSQKGSTTGYKISYLPKEIVASQETINNAINQANIFAGDCRDVKSFDANYEKNLKPKGINKASASVGPRDANITGLGYARQFVKDIYDAKLGEVLKPEKVDMDTYEVEVVAVVTEILKEGTQSVAKARPAVEAILKNKKKAELLKQKVGKITTLEAAALALGNKTIENADSVRIDARMAKNPLGYEPRVIGAAFNPVNKGKVIPEVLAGINGVYVVRVNGVTTTPMTTNVEDSRKQLIQQSRQSSNPIDGLKKAANITDQRAKRY